MNDLPVITLLTILPLVGGIIVAGVETERRSLARGLALFTSLAALAIVLGLWHSFDPTTADLQFVERHAWIPSLGIDYFVGLDGMSLLMVLLTGLVVPMAMLTGWKVSDRAPLFFSLMLFLQSGLFGAFTALNFFHWFIFWEISLVPAYFLIRLWGGRDRGPASLQFFVYTMVGSAAMLLSFLAIFHATRTWDFIKLAEMGRQGELASALSVKLGWGGLSTKALTGVIFLGVLLGFAVKVPMLPLHTWLPSAYAEAPSSVTMLLTGVMSKMGVYGLLRILLPIFPDQVREWLTPLLWLAVATVVLPVFAAFAQRDIKRVFAYSSINHLGYCLLGMFAAMAPADPQVAMANERAAVLSGVLLQMFNHGITAAALFAFISFLEDRSGGLRGMGDFGGLRKPAPALCGLMGVAVFASLGLPGLNGFVGEFLIFKGTFALSAWAAVLSSLALLVTAVFLLTFLQKVFHGPLSERWAGFQDLGGRERVIVLPAVMLMFAVGLFPQFVLSVTTRTVAGLLENLFL
jgi:NADH-quinone oxidoreductase subunit M